MVGLNLLTGVGRGTTVVLSGDETLVIPTPSPERSSPPFDQML
jgi:hypothetical protein